MLRLFASAREAAGTDRAQFDGATVGELLDQARHRFGDEFAAVLEVSNVWVNGDQAALDTEISERDEVAVLPPVSGGA